MNWSLTNHFFPDIEYLKSKIGEREYEVLRAVLNQNADVFQNIKRILFVVISSSMKSNWKKAPFPTGPTGKRMTARIRYDRTLTVTMGLWR